MFIVESYYRIVVNYNLCMRAENVKLILRSLGRKLIEKSIQLLSLCSDPLYFFLDEILGTEVRVLSHFVAQI
jgi:hypothetical protein